MTFTTSAKKVGLLICTLIPENQGLEKLRSAFQTLEKFQVLHTLIFFFSLSPWFFSGLWYESSFFSRWRPRKKSRFAGTENFLRFEADLDFSRAWFSEIKVQIKRPMEWCFLSRKVVCVNFDIDVSLAWN